MLLSFRWYGSSDPIPLQYIRQIPMVTGIVTACYDIPVGEVWTLERIHRMVDEIETAALTWSVVESLNVHEDIKLGRPTRDRLIDQYCESLGNLGAAGIPVVCYNFMPAFDWMRTDLARPAPDGSTSLSYDDVAIRAYDLTRGTEGLPGWGRSVSASELSALLGAYSTLSDDMLWDHLAYFLERVVPAAQEAGVKMAIHPDDPPWTIFGLPRIVTNRDALARILSIVDEPANGLTFCTGSLGADPANDLPAMIREFGSRIHFAHCRNVKHTGYRSFHEVAHPSDLGDVDMKEVMRAYRDVGFTGPMRPDHGRMIWGETGHPGYGLYDRALGATYLYGLWEGLETINDKR